MNFDRVAEVYDATRAMPEDVTDRIMQRVIESVHAGAETRFLEIGIGTGRIALPFIEAGYRYVGVDRSEQMVARLRAKVGDATNLELMFGDVTALPLPDATVDVVMSVHVLHLVPEWRKALDEVQRVLRPGGVFVIGQEWTPEGDERGAIRSRWRELVEAHGAPLQPRYGTWDAVDAEVTARRGRTAVYHAATWVEPFRAGDLIEALRRRVFSHTWSVPEDVVEAVHAEIVVWATERYGSLDADLKARKDFLLAITRFDPAPAPAP